MDFKTDDSSIGQHMVNLILESDSPEPVKLNRLQNLQLELYGDKTNNTLNKLLEELRHITEVSLHTELSVALTTISEIEDVDSHEKMEAVKDITFKKTWKLS